MGYAEETLGELSRYGRVARNCQMLLVMEPSDHGLVHVEEARETIAEDGLDYLSEVEEGIESPYFTTYTRQDARFIAHLAAEKIRQAEWDRVGIFDMAEPRIRMGDAKPAEAASFAYLAASCMPRFKAPFYYAPSLRATVVSPRNLAEFVSLVETVKEVTSQARDERFRKVVERNDWRVAFVFWEATKWLAQSLRAN